MAVSPSTGSRPPLQKSLSRRVSFNEASLRRRHDSDTESQADNNGGRIHFCGLICSSFCFWISFVLGLILFAIIVGGGAYYGFLKTNLPEARLYRLDVNQLDVVSTNKDDTFLSADFGIVLNVTNDSGKVELIYSEMTARVSTAGAYFGEFRLEDLHQPQSNTTGIKVAVVVKNVEVEEAAAKELQENAKIHMLVINMEVRGKIDVFAGGKKLNGFPFKIECLKIDQSEIDDGHAPKCTTQLTPIR